MNNNLQTASLFIGGSLDGELIVVEPGLNRYRAPHLPPSAIGKTFGKVEFEYDEYIMEKFRAGNAVYSVFRLIDESVDKAFERILIGYSELAKLSKENK